MRPIRDYPPDDYGAVEGGVSRLVRLRRGLSTAIGAVVALALLVALGVWFYRLGVRDADDIPIIRASAEPTKTRPDEPGGVVAPYQEITSYGVAEQGRTNSPSALTAPPPPEPRREDVAMATLAPEPMERPGAASWPGSSPERSSGREGSARGAAAGGEEPETVGEPARRPAASVGSEGEAEEIAALVRQATLDAATTPRPGTVAGALNDPVPGASDYAPPRSPVAPQRPSDLLARVQAALRSAEQNATERARQAAESAIQIQLATDRDEEIVRAMWRRISQANSDILHDRELAVQSTVSGGATYYRLRVGPFSGMSEARAVCQALKARGQDCIVARNG